MFRSSENRRRSTRRFNRGAGKTRRENLMVRRGGFRL